MAKIVCDPLWVVDDSASRAARRAYEQALSPIQEILRKQDALMAKPDLSRLARTVGRVDALAARHAGLSDTAFARLTKYAAPSIAAYEMPKMPTFQVPSLPSHLLPSLPTYGMPQLPKFDFPRLPKYVLPDLNKSYLNLGGWAESLAKLFAEAHPTNWPPDSEDLDWDLLEQIVATEGIPIVWVPRREIVDALLAAADRESRLNILMSRRSDIVDDCRAVLSTVECEEINDLLPLAGNALDAFDAGHDNAAMALAVALVESGVSTVIPGGTKKLNRAVSFSIDRVPFLLLRAYGALGTIPTLYTSWFKSEGSPPPETLSRHVVSHALTTEVMRDEHPLLAMMYLASILRGLEDWVTHEMARIDLDE
jgi:hypothetical protein